MKIAEAFIKSLEEQLGNSTAELLLKSLSDNSPTSIRTNPFKPIERSGYFNAIPWCSMGYYLPERPSFTLDPAFHAGGYYVQEASSMFLEQALVHAADLRQPLRVLDLCAAPGGKSTHILSLLNAESLLVSNEVIRSRANILAENITKWGNANSIVTNNDPQAFAALTGYFDVVVIDAPCSGEGLFRKEPEAMEEWSPDHVQLCAMRQRRILSDVWPALKQDGLLIYSTCTYNRSENEENLQWLQTQHDVEFLSIPLPANSGIEEVHSGNVIGYRFYPHRVTGEGFFLSVIRKRSGESESSMTSKNKIKSVNIPTAVTNHILEPNQFYFFERPEGLRMIPEHFSEDLAKLAQHTFILQAGTCLGTFKHDKYIPDHALALSNHLAKQAISTVTLDHRQAIQYLRKETLAMEVERGYALVTYQGLGLGWINGLGNRINNLYPMNWRVKMSSKD